MEGRDNISSQFLLLYFTPGLKRFRIVTSVKKKENAIIFPHCSSAPSSIVIFYRDGNKRRVHSPVQCTCTKNTRMFLCINRGQPGLEFHFRNVVCIFTVECRLRQQQDGLLYIFLFCFSLGNTHAFWRIYDSRTDTQKDLFPFLFFLIGVWQSASQLPRARNKLASQDHFHFER